tara:strand:+ start:426 stop:587 length:162 start_codon:yes stop_codon:yes gene_type:complete
MITPAWHGSFHQRVKCLAVAEVMQMAQFMDDHHIDGNWRFLHKRGVQANVTTS